MKLLRRREILIKARIRRLKALLLHLPGARIRRLKALLLHLPGDGSLSCLLLQPIAQTRGT